LRAKIAPALRQATVERQIKYLGLIIEKDAELDLSEDDAPMYRSYRGLAEERTAFNAGRRNLEDGRYQHR